MNKYGNYEIRQNRFNSVSDLISFVNTVWNTLYNLSDTNGKYAILIRIRYIYIFLNTFNTDAIVWFSILGKSFKRVRIRFFYIRFSVGFFNFLKRPTNLQ